MAKRKTKLLIALLVIVALMVVVALTLYEWNGVFILEGILAGIGMAIGTIIDRMNRSK